MISSYDAKKAHVGCLIERWMDTLEISIGVYACKYIFQVKLACQIFKTAQIKYPFLSDFI